MNDQGIVTIFSPLYPRQVKELQALAACCYPEHASREKFHPLVVQK